MELLLAAFLFFLPAGVANMTPILAARAPLLRHWNTPLDLGRSYRGIRLFGDHKTWRGLVSGTVIGTLTGLLLFAGGFHPDVPAPLIAMAAAMSLGALVGDALESFFKRRRGVSTGKVWFPFDQLDYIIGGLVFILPFGIPSWRLMLAVIVLYFGLHLLMSYVGFILKLKSRPL